MQKLKNILLDYPVTIFMLDFTLARNAFIPLDIKNISDQSVVRTLYWPEKSNLIHPLIVVTAIFVVI